MRALLIAALVLSTLTSQAQLTFPADGGSTKGYVGEDIGLTNVRIDYGRPAVRGREGKIWGELVYTGYAPNPGFGSATKLPWRAGANENTTISFSTDVMIEGKRLAAGKYGFFIAYDPKECTLIFSKDIDSWGSFYYNENNDALHVTVKPQPANASIERLTYTVEPLTDSSANVVLSWEKLRIPFTVSTELQKLQLASIDREMQSSKGFTIGAFYEVALYYIEKNIRLDDAMKYITAASRSMPNFNVLRTKSELEEKMGKTAESKETFKAAINATNSAQQAHNYARTLLPSDAQKAFNIFKMNYDHYPNVYTTNMGMARGYSAIGNYKEALKYANKALPQAPDANNKTTVEKSIAVLKEGKDINTM